MSQSTRTDTIIPRGRMLPVGHIVGVTDRRYITVRYVPQKRDIPFMQDTDTSKTLPDGGKDAEK